MLVTVAVCTYQRFEWLKSCLDKLNQQTLSHDKYNILVIDNSLQPELSTQFKESLHHINNLEYIITEKCGIAYARNEALRHCKTDVIAFTDDDCLVPDNWVETIVELFTRHPVSVAAIGGKVKPLWEEQPPAWLSEDLLSCLALIDWGEQDIFLDDMRIKWLITANTAYRAEALSRAGGFPEQLGRKRKLPLAQEEFAANQALRTHGYEILYTPLMEVSHFIPASRVTQYMLCRDAFWEGVSQALYRQQGLTGEDTDELSNVLFPIQDQALNKSDELKNKEEIEQKRIHLRQIGLSEAGKLLKRSTILDPLHLEAWPVVYIVTPSFNAVDTIDQTISSVINQAGQFSIRYHIQDGGSTDGTLEKLQIWQNRLLNQLHPIYCKNIVFTYESSPDQGMYDALVKGFNNFTMPYNAFMTWINADDILLPGALALVNSLAQQFNPEQLSWLTGQCAVFKNNTQISHVDRPTPTEVIKRGLCEGQHWHFIQQEGTFFRNWLWKKVEGPKTIKKYKYAGDWHLWRLFAHQAVLVEAKWSLGAFNLREGQLSQKYFNQYIGEINHTINHEDRARALKELSTSCLRRCTLKPSYPTDKFKLVYEKVENYGYWYHKNFKKWPRKQVDENYISNGIEDVLPSAVSTGGGLQSQSIKFAPYIIDNPIIKEGRNRFSGLQESKDNTCNKKPFVTFKKELGITIYIVTPSLNSVKTIDETIRSIINQSGNFSIRYHIQDGASTDGTLDILKKWKQKIANSNHQIFCKDISFTYISEKDNGVYDAIGRGFDNMKPGNRDFMAWLNSNDILMPGALKTISMIAESQPKIEWVGGPKYVIDAQGKTLLERQVPTPTEVVKEGLCDGKHWHMLPQEGLFYRKALWFKTRHALNKMNLAGDWNLWRNMAHYASYYQALKPLGAFRKHENQLSIYRHSEYMEEINILMPLEQRAQAFQRLSKLDLHANLVYYNAEINQIETRIDRQAVSEIFKIYLDKNFNNCR